MRHLALLVLVLLAADAEGRDRRCRRDRFGRAQDSCSSLAQFEAFNLISTNWCTTDPIVGARGEALTGTRATAGTCTKGVDGLRSTGIADGDLVSLGVNVMRAEADADGYLGLLVEGAASPITIQSRPICNAAWADVGTPGCTADNITGPWGTQTMARILDDDAAAKEGRSQTMATTSATRFTAYCYVKSGSVGEATITLAGTGNAAGDCSATLTGLSGTTSSIISCTSAVAYTGAVTAVTVSILAGDAVGDTGTMFVEGCNVVPSATYRTSFTDAAAVTVARAAETATIAAAFPTGSSFCLAASYTSTHSLANGNALTAINDAASDTTPQALVYHSAGQGAGYSVNPGTLALTGVVSASGTHRLIYNSTRAISYDGTAGPTIAATTTNAAGVSFSVGTNGAVGITAPDAIVTRIQADPTVTRCLP